jgi:hypothetical protein
LKKLSWLFIALALMVIPALAQDEGDGGFNINDLFSNESASDAPATDPRADLMDEVKNLLRRANAPLDKKQEKPLQKIYDNELKTLGKPFEKQFGVSLSSALATQNSGRGRRGAVRAGPQATEVRRLSDHLANKVIAALRIDQQAALRRYQSEQLRVQRLNVVTQSVAAAGLPLTSEQKAQVEALYARESRLRTLIIVEAQGQPHAAKVAQLEAQTTQRVVELMNETQKTALAQGMARARAR